jgi:hypothetical protein
VAVPQANSLRKKVATAPIKAPTPVAKTTHLITLMNRMDSSANRFFMGCIPFWILIPQQLKCGSLSG